MPPSRRPESWGAVGLRIFNLLQDGNPPQDSASQREIYVMKTGGLALWISCRSGHMANLKGPYFRLWTHSKIQAFAWFLRAHGRNLKRTTSSTSAWSLCNSAILFGKVRTHEFTIFGGMLAQIWVCPWKWGDTSEKQVWYVMICLYRVIHIYIYVCIHIVIPHHCNPNGLICH